MATIKLKFRPSSVANKKGTLYFQVIHKRNVKWISTGYHVFPNEWDKAREMLIIPPDDERRKELLTLQSMLSTELKRRRVALQQMEGEASSFNVNALCNVFDTPQLSPTTVFAFLQRQVAKKEEMGRQGTATTYANAFARFKDFRQGIDLTFDELSADMIERYEAWLINRRLMPNSIRFYLRTLNTLLLKAVEGGLLKDRELFSRVRLSYVTTVKRAITESELKAIERIPLMEGSPLAFARDIFMFSFYMRGMAFVDIAYLRKTDLRNGLLVYCRKKTNQHLMVAWEKEQQQIVDRYAHLTKDSPYLLPILLQEDGTEYLQYQRVLDNVNNSLKKLGELIGLKMPLTTYVARHTWASVARDMNISVAIISEGMGHRSYKTTQVYLNSIDSSRINEANKKIIRRIRAR